MDDETLTPWMRACDPVHVGWYQVRGPFGDVGLRWWDGSIWRLHPAGAAVMCGKRYGDAWRGLVAPHAGGKA